MADFTGANHKPYRLPAPGMMDLCGRGKFLHAHGEESAPRLVNQTKVLKNVGGVVTSNNPPFARLDPAQHNGGAGAIDGACVAADPGKCGIWLSNGDSGGISEREVDYTLGDDIRPAGAGEAVNDHNAYKADGTKKTFTTCKKQGAKFVHFRKYWHGLFGYTSNDRCTPPDANIGADQTRYLTQLISAKWSQGGSIETHIDQWQSTTPGFPGGAKSGGISESIDLSDAYGGSDERSQQVSTAKLTGINTLDAKVASDATSFTHTQTTTIPGPGPSDGTTVSSPGSSGSYGFAFPRACWIHNTIGCMGVTLSFGGVQPNELYPGSPSYPPISGTPTEINDAVTAIQMFSTPAGTYFQGSVDTLIISPTEITVILKFRPSSTAPFLVTTEGPTIYGWRINESTYTLSGEFTFTLRMSLTNVYTSYECYDHLLTAAAAWDLASDLAYPFRTDEVFATIPAIFYDEVGPTTPSIPIPDTMNDYSLAFDAGNSVWLQRTWLDDQDYYWTINSGARSGKRGIPDTTETATITTALRTGTIVAHTTAGSDGHFWFNFKKVVKDAGVWVLDSTGDYSPGYCPETTMRWLNDLESMYDPDIGNRGIWPQQYLHEVGGIVTGAKYVETMPVSRSYDFARPCAEDVFSVDQFSVCHIDSSIPGSFDVSPTQGAIPPLSNIVNSYGLQVGDIVIVQGASTDGVFQITSITPLGGSGAFTINVGAILNVLPTGYVFSPYSGDAFVGRARFWDRPGLAGRVFARFTDDGTGKIKITFPSAELWLRAGETVSIWTDLMVLQAGGAITTRTSDTEMIVNAAFTAITAASMWVTVTGASEWFWHDNHPKGDGVYLSYLFNPRAAFATTPPTFYVEDCTSLQAIQFRIPHLTCTPTVIGIVPYQSALIALDSLPDEAVDMPLDSLPALDTPIDTASGLFSAGAPIEKFHNAALFGFPPSFPFDSYYSAHYQSAVEPVMVDPLWQRPFAPNWDGSTFIWTEDDGTGKTDNSPTNYHYYAARPLVEALVGRPFGAGWFSNLQSPTLPTGYQFAYDPAPPNLIPPHSYPLGLTLANGGKVVAGRPYAFVIRACANTGNFSTDYAKFIVCS